MTWRQRWDVDVDVSADVAVAVIVDAEWMFECVIIYSVLVFVVVQVHTMVFPRSQQLQGNDPIRKRSLCELQMNLNII